MDLSSEYIKMCSCMEIQSQSPLVFHPARSWGGEDIYVSNIGNDVYIRWKNRTAVVWLPRQDQLQAMVEKKNTRELLFRFTDWIEKYTDYRRESMEQLWLAFVMKEKFGKVWDKKEWKSEVLEMW